MEQQKKQPTPPNDTAVLHLNKFAPGKADASANATPTPEDTATIFIKKAAAETVEQSAQPVVAPQSGNALPPKEMLGAVTYCYAKGVYTSEEIERKMLKDPELRAATKGEIPNAHCIRRFRRLNREAIQTTLEKWYRKLRRQKSPTEVLAGAQPPEPSPLAPGPGPQQAPENTTTFAKREAAEQLNKAAFIDNMSKDG
jgi:transposase